jgi:hypothetical protein
MSGQMLGNALQRTPVIMAIPSSPRDSVPLKQVVSLANDS